MRGGLSFPGTNIVAICTKAWWQNKLSNSQHEVIIHEIGHQIKMVTDGSGKLPAKTPNHYIGKGHIENHCKSELSVAKKGATNYGSLTPTPPSNCVMYGATNGHSSFCSDCAKAVKKIDLSNGV